MEHTSHMSCMLFSSEALSPSQQALPRWSPKNSQKRKKQKQKRTTIVFGMSDDFHLSLNIVIFAEPIFFIVPAIPSFYFPLLKNIKYRWGNTVKLSSPFHKTACIQMAVLQTKRLPYLRQLPISWLKMFVWMPRGKKSKCSLMYNVNIKQLYGSWSQVYKGLCDGQARKKITGKT